MEGYTSSNLFQSSIATLDETQGNEENQQLLQKSEEVSDNNELSDNNTQVRFSEPLEKNPIEKSEAKTVKESNNMLSKLLFAFPGLVPQ